MGDPSQHTPEFRSQLLAYDALHRAMTESYGETMRFVANVKKSVAELKLLRLLAGVKNTDTDLGGARMIDALEKAASDILDQEGDLSCAQNDSCEMLEDLTMQRASQLPLVGVCASPAGVRNDFQTANTVQVTFVNGMSEEILSDPAVYAAAATTSSFINLQADLRKLDQNIRQLHHEASRYAALAGWGPGGNEWDGTPILGVLIEFWVSITCICGDLDKIETHALYDLKRFLGRPTTGTMYYH